MSWVAGELVLDGETWQLQDEGGYQLSLCPGERVGETSECRPLTEPEARRYFDLIPDDKKEEYARLGFEFWNKPKSEHGKIRLALEARRKGERK